MPKDPTFTIITPVYNAEDYLEETLKSIIAQPYTAWRLIAVNDGSVDSSAKILNEYASMDSRITVIHKENQGPLLARVDAIKKAESNYCVFIDADDLIAPNFFNVLVDEIRHYPHDIFIFSYSVLYQSGVVKPFSRSPFTNGEVFEKGKTDQAFKESVVDGRLNSLWTKAIKTELLKNDPTDYSQFKDIFCGEDLLLLLNPFSAASTIKYLDEPLYCYRMSTTSITRTLNPKKLKSILQVYEQLLCYVKLWQTDGYDYNIRYIRTYGTTVIGYLGEATIQGASFANVTELLEELKHNDPIFKTFLTTIFSKNLPLSNRQHVARYLINHGFFRIFYWYYSHRKPWRQD